MSNGNPRQIHLTQTRFHTPLFRFATKGISSYAQNLQKPAKYLIINSAAKINDQIFKECSSICQFYSNDSRTYISLEGECLWDYFRAKKESDFVLSQESIWCMLRSVVQTLLVLRKYGIQHSHIKQYVIRRINEHQFKLIYHPQMVDQFQCAKANVIKWDHLYFSPEELAEGKRSVNSNVFSLAAMVLNIMNPLDFNRLIYEKDHYRIDKIVLNQKLINAAKRYSHDLMQLIEYCLIEDHSKRMTLELFYLNICNNKLSEKKKQFTEQIKERVLLQSSQSKMKQMTKFKDTTKKHGESYKKPKFQTPVVKKKTEDTASKAKSNSTNASKLQESQQKKEDCQSNTEQTESKSNEIHIPFHRGTFGGNEAISQVPSENEKSSIHFAKTGNQILIQQNDSSNTSNITSNEKSKQNPYVLTQFQFGEYTEIQDIISPKGFGGSHQFTTAIEEIQPKNKKQEVIPTKKQEVLPKKCEIKPKQQEQEEISEIPDQLSEQEQQPKEKAFLTLQLCLKPLNEIIQFIGSAGIWIQGDRYYGDFKHGRRVGLGLEIFPQNQYFFGNFVDDLFHGEGFYYWSPKQYFLGVFQNGQKTYGTLYGRRKYIGSFKNNKFHGHGQCIFEDGSIYKGNWANGKRHGAGTMIEVTGDKFIGKYKNGKKYEKGTYYTQNSTINGFWVDDKIVGQAQIEYKNGIIYSGGVNQSFEKHGHGAYKFKSGSSYVGQFQQNEFVFGQIIYKNGERYVGNVKDGLRHGMGQYFYNNGTTWKGRWDRNNKMEEKKN